MAHVIKENFLTEIRRAFPADRRWDDDDIIPYVACSRGLSLGIGTKQMPAQRIFRLSRSCILAYRSHPIVSTSLYCKQSYTAGYCHLLSTIS